MKGKMKYEGAQCDTNAGVNFFPLPICVCMSCVLWVRLAFWGEITSLDITEVSLIFLGHVNN